MNIPYVFKKCSKCEEWLVASTYNFHKDKQCEYGLKSQCKKCRAEQHKQYNKQNREKISEQKKQYYKNNKDKKKQYYENNKEYYTEYHKQYYKNNKDKIKQYNKQNREKILEQKKQYRENNKDKISEYGKQYRATPRGQVLIFNKHCRRRLRKQNQGDGINKEQWLEMMKYFEFRCAYSGEILSKDTRSIDHIIPLNKNGEHEIWNVVPMDRSYNISKLDKEMLQWYKEQPFFSEERLQKIYEWQEYAYNKWHKEEIV